MKRLILAIFTLSSVTAQASDKIKYFFNKPVDTTISSGTNAIYLHNCIADTLAAYLNRAQYSLDICVYDFDKTISYSNTTPDTLFAPKIAAAIDSAYARGVKVRYIYEAGNSNTGLSLIDTAHIHTLGSPQGSAYTIMHNKFVIIDAKSPYNTDPIVWTGCLNWYVEQFNWDYNNVVVLQDSALAHAYTAEFNMMWGDTGLVPNLSTSKFGQFKTDLGMHHFLIGGDSVELYFSPSDNTDSRIQSTISSANKDLYFGVYTFTEHNDADLIVSKYNAGLNVYGINDSWSNGYYATTTFTASLGSHFEVYTESTDTLFHNKFVIIDPSDTCSDPRVLTGSHNWTTSANTKNDENTLIIHSATAANQYLQYFKACYNTIGGAMSVPANNCTPIYVGDKTLNKDMFTLYPNPAGNEINVICQLGVPHVVSIELYNAIGEKVSALVTNDALSAGVHQFHYKTEIPGLYFVKIISDGAVTIQKLMVLGAK